MRGERLPLRLCCRTVGTPSLFPGLCTADRVVCCPQTSQHRLLLSAAAASARTLLKPRPRCLNCGTPLAVLALMPRAARLETTLSTRSPTPRPRNVGAARTVGQPHQSLTGRIQCPARSAERRCHAGSGGALTRSATSPPIDFVALPPPSTGSRNARAVGSASDHDQAGRRDKVPDRRGCN